MQVIGLMGYVDKHDFLLNMAKVLNIMEKSVLVIDGTHDKKLKYIIPAIDATSKNYITKYSDVDFAVGFNNFDEFEGYLKDHDIKLDLYDFVLIDIDTAESYRKFNKKDFTRKYMFIDTDLLSVAKNKELVKTIRENIPEGEIKFTKVLYRAYLSRASEEYLENQIATYNVSWQEENYEIMMDEQDKMVDIDSQFSGNIMLKKHTRMFILSIAQLVSVLIEESDPKNIIKQIKRRKS